MAFKVIKTGIGGGFKTVNNTNSGKFTMSTAANIPSIVTNDLAFNFNASNPSSYPGTGTSWTDTTNGNVGTLTNGPTYSSDNGGYFTFNGTNEYVTAPHSSTLSLNPYLTLEAWIYQTTDYYNMIITKQPSGNAQNFFPGNYELRTEPGGKLALGWQYDSFTQYAYTFIVTGNGSIPLNTWKHVMVTSETAANTKFYIDGSLVASSISYNGGPNYGNPPPMAVNTNPFRIGSRQDCCNFPGRISEVRGYSRILSASEVLQNYDATKTRFGL
jgi:hypothetical protein